MEFFKCFLSDANKSLASLMMKVRAHTCIFCSDSGQAPHPHVALVPIWPPPTSGRFTLFSPRHLPPEPVCRCRLPGGPASGGPCLVPPEPCPAALSLSWSQRSSRLEGRPFSLLPCHFLSALGAASVLPELC